MKCLAYFWHVIYECFTTVSSVQKGSWIQVQYIHLISLPFDRTSASDRLYKYLWITCRTIAKHMKDRRSLRIKAKFIVRSSMPIYLYIYISFIDCSWYKNKINWNWESIRRAVVYCTQATHAFSVENECRHCTKFFNCVVYQLISIIVESSDVSFQLLYRSINPFNAEATFDQRIRTQRVLKTI